MAIDNTPNPQVSPAGEVPRIQIQVRQDETPQTAPKPSPGFPAVAWGIDTALILALGGNWLYKQVLEPRLNKLRHNLLYSLDTDKQVQGIIYQLQALNKCDRAVLLLARNGEKLLNGLPYYKLFVYAEAVAPGLAPFGDKAGDIPSAQLVKMIKILSENKVLVTRDGEDFPDAHMDHLAHICNIKAAVSVYLEDNGIPLGVLMLQFSGEEAKKVSEFDVRKVDGVVDLIEALLTVQKTDFISSLTATLRGKLP